MSSPIPFLPRTEAGLLTYCTNFDEKINEVPADFGLTEPQAAAYSTLFTTFAARYQAANQAGTRTPQIIDLKNIAKEELIAETRRLAADIRSSIDVTDANKLLLGLNIAPDEPTPIPAPTTAPALVIESTVGRSVKFRLHDADNHSGRARPPHVKGAAIYYYVGDTKPDNLRDWTFEGNTNKVRGKVTVPDDVPGGSTVWLTAFWIGTKMDAGPACEAVQAHIPGGLAQAG